MISGLFYEEIGVDEASAVKMASIYFDQVYVLTPVSLIKGDEPIIGNEEVQKQLHRQFRDILGPKLTNIELENSPRTVSTLNFQVTARDLIDSGVITIVNPFDEMKSLNLKEEFANIIKEAAKDKVPETTGISRCENIQGAIFNKAIDFQPSTYLIDEPECHLAESFEYESGFFGHPSHDWHSIVSNPRARRESLGNRDLLYKIPEQTLHKILVKSALLVSKKQKAFPISSNEYADDRLWKSTTESLQSIGKEELKELQHKLKESRSIQSYLILKEIIVQNLPDFSELPFTEILVARIKYQDELKALRSFLYKLATTIESETDIERLPHVISDIVSREVNPAITDLERKIKAAKQKIPHRMLDRVAMTTTSSLAATVIANLPIYYSPLFSAAILGAVASSEAYREILDITDL